MSIVIPASNEAGRIRACLDSLLAQEGVPWAVEVIVVANGCRDDTASAARALAGRFAARGWRLLVLERAEGGKIGALNAGDDAATGEPRLYLDADIVLSPRLLGALLRQLAAPAPVYAGARMVVAPTRSALSRIYARFWLSLPFHSRGVTGAGLFAVNAAGRARWGRFPEVIGDDAYVRALFAPAERRRVEEPYLWPISEGFRALVRVRRRQDAGVRELARRFPEQAAQADDRPGRAELARLAAADPAGFAVYAAVALATRLGRGKGWARDR